VSSAVGSPINEEVGSLTGMGALFFKNMPFLWPLWYDAQLANRQINNIVSSIFIRMNPDQSSYLNNQ